MMRTNSTRQWWITGPLLSGVLGISACAPVQPPHASLSQADLAIRQASESNASQYAPMELQSAREKLAEARIALDAGQYERAHRLAEQALIDARLAEARSEVESSRQTAHDLRLTIEALREEAARSSAATVYPPLSVPIELRSAREKLDEALVALDTRQYEQAHRLAEQALVDAQAAEMRADTESARQAARDLRLSIETLRDSAARTVVVYPPPYSPVELQSATEKLDEAQVALGARAYERARRLAENGLVDARVAEMRAETESARQAARDLRQRLESLRAEAAMMVALY
jgi:HEPN domain-containing protein